MMGQNGGRKMQVYAPTWVRIPWNRNCDDCAHFAAAPRPMQSNTDLCNAVWNHFNLTHHIELTGDPWLRDCL